MRRMMMQERSQEPALVVKTGAEAITFDRITVDPEVMGGIPCIGGFLRLSKLVEMITDGMSHQEILAEFPLLEAEDIEQGLDYAALVIKAFLLSPSIPNRFEHPAWARKLPAKPLTPAP
jgi:uncharacterized protein (DUF433 family)